MSSISVVLVHDNVKFAIQRHCIDILVFTSTSASSTNSLFGLHYVGMTSAKVRQIIIPSKQFHSFVVQRANFKTLKC